MALFRVDFSGRGELSERQQKVMHLGFFTSALYLLVPSQLAQVRCLVVGAMLIQTLAQMLSKLSKISEEFNASHTLKDD
jgi:Rad51